MKKTRTHKSIIKNLWTYALAFLLVLSNFTGLIQADGPDPQVDPSTPVVEEREVPTDENHEEENTKPQEEIPEDQTKPTEEDENSENTSENAEEEITIEEDTDESENDGLEISDEVKPEAVKEGTIPAPTINAVFEGATSISGKKLHRDRVNNKVVRATVYVSLKDSSGTEKANLSVTPKSGANWTVNLPEGVQVAKGDTVTVYQELNGNKSPEVTADAKSSLASGNKDKLQMPTGEVWIENTSSNLVNEDEQAEAVKMLKDVNAEIASDISSVEFSIDGTEHAYYEVTYTDNSTSGKIEATDLKIQQVTETSMGADLDSITVVDNVIKGKLTGEGPFTDIKVQLILKVSGFDKSKFCDKKCTLDKNSSKPVDAVVDTTTGKFTYTLTGTEKIELDQVVGVTVKEKNKFISCSTTETVALKTPSKTEVRDPRTLTDEDKKAIDKAIRDANTVNGESKLPNGTGFIDDPAFIEFDSDGNARIISPNDVVVDWDNDGNPIFQKNDDGTYKLQTGKENNVIKIPAKDLVKNVKPDAPTLTHDADKPEITITPNEKDTDAQKIEVKYTGIDGQQKTITATKNDQGAWSTNDSDVTITDKGVITLPTSKIQGGSKITATVTDIGGLSEGENPLDSTEGDTTLSKAQKVKDLGGLDPVDIKKWVGEDPGWKEGVQAKDSNNEAEVKKLLNENGTRFADTTRNTSTQGDFEGTIKVTFDDGSSLEVANQKLYVSNHVSPENKENLPEDAIDVELKLGEGVKVDDTNGNKDNPVSYKKYKVKPNTNLSEYKFKDNKSVFDSINLTAQDTYTDSVWKSQNTTNPNNFVATNDNKVFIATATKTFKVTLDPNSGSGTMDGATVNKNGTYKLPENKFTPPNENQEFSGWQIGVDSNNLKQAGNEITITGDTVIKAIWKPIESKVKFQTETGASGTMEDKAVDKGSKYELPKPTFTPEEGKEFAGWKVGDSTELKQVGEKIDISGDVTITATWKDIMVKVTYDANGGSGEMTGATQKKGSSYKLLANGFTAPANQKFKAWKIGETEYQPDAEITVNENTTVTAIWEDIEYKVTFNGNTGTGKMDEKLVKKGNEFELPSNGFTPPANKEFDGWMVGNDKKAVGDKITVNGDTVVKAIWKDKSKPNPEPNPGDTPGTNPGSNPGYYPDPTPNPTPNPNKPDNNKDNKKDEPKKPDTPTPPQPGPGKEELPVNPKPDGTQEITPDPEKTDEVEVTVTPDGKDPEKVKVEKDKDGNWITDRPHILKVDPKTGKITVAKGVKDVRAIATLKLERGFHERYLYGYVDGTVRPEGFITRCEAAALIARLANLDMTNSDKPNFPDTPSAWYNTAINAVVAKNLMFADANGNFRPQEPITRGEFARALYYIDRHNDEVAPFEDIKGHIYEAAINQAYGNGLINGYLDGTFKPDAPIQRAEATKILNKYANRGVDHDGLSLVRQDLIHFTDIDESHWAYYEIMEAANTHEYERVVSTLYETWLKIIYDTKMK